ncbi:SAM-dependent methyltransferase [Pelagibaculum spongiae]|uniref:SAM-dependent methyltransferase n=1 Tax=Pelagibaculum spongiae TaxID=2080658 RepID=A0A2V1GXM5_9GAMM|nr:cyclopropane-fatty-acyl-phospholipid synthase family protein [Pelagibaculum spongiae]PVZ66394.1 SAM-dependent methyltransferase [Pelagibaculum spongiae]
MDKTISTSGVANISWSENTSKKILLKLLKKIENGHLTIIDEQQKRLEFGGCGQRADLKATVIIQQPQAWKALLTGGSIGAGESFMRGDWQTPNLTPVIQLLLANLSVLDQLDSRFSRIAAPLFSIAHWLKDNSKKGSQKNISAHYDLSNDFFRQFLDPEMMYSCAWFKGQTTTLEQAAVDKLELICQKLELSADDHLLEIGTGWGGMAIYAAQKYGCKVTTTTISDQQYSYTKQRIESLGLQDRVTLLKSDYRDLTGQYDKLVSIEMIEAVGHKYLDTYFKKLDQLIKPSGLALIQAITILDQRYHQAKNSVDFIQRYIFPGGALPSITRISQGLTKTSQLAIVDAHSIGQHYAKTLSEWRKRFLENIEQVKQLGFDQSFINRWLFYLGYCEGGFLERHTDTYQLLLAAPGRKRHAGDKKWLD